MFRIYDTLNGWRNMRGATEFVKRKGAVAEITICHTASPVHSVETFVQMAHVLEDMGADTVCATELAGLLSSYIPCP